MRSFIVLFVLAISSIFILNDYKKHERAKEINRIFSGYISQIESSYGIKLGVYIKDLNNGFVYEYNSTSKFPAASLIKLPIMVGVIKKVVDEGIPYTKTLRFERRHRVGGSGILKKMPLNTYYSIDTLLSLMICESDNSATQILTEFAGRDYIRNVIRWLEMGDTEFNRDIMDLRSLNLGIENFTTARDIGILLEKIYKGKIISREASYKMIEYLLNQKIHDRIASAIPFGIVANKTGLMRNAVHDAGIVIAGSSRFIICVLTTNFPSYKIAKNVIKKITEITYNTISS